MRLSLKSGSKFCVFVLCILSLPGSAQVNDRHLGGLALADKEAISPAASQTPAEQLDVELVNVSSADTDKADVLAALKNLMKALAHRDIAQIGDCLSEDVTTFDDGSGNFLYGKVSVLAHVEKNVIGTGGDQPVKRLVVYNPIVNVKGQTAMVSFRATKELSGGKSTTLESWCSEVFERKNGQWLVLQLRTNWKPAKSHDERR